VYVDGTTNMTTTNLALSFVSKGHFYQISPEVTSSVPVIVDSSGNTIVPSETDETYLGYEPITGVNVYASERLLNNFQVFNDELFSIVNNSPDFGTFLPLLYVVRQFKMTDA
jgi:CD36 family